MDLVVLWIISAFIAAAIGGRKGEAGLGFLVGAILGPLGIVFALLSSGNRVPCPQCHELMHKKAAVCPHCRTPVAAKP